MNGQRFLWTFVVGSIAVLAVIPWTSGGNTEVWVRVLGSTICPAILLWAWWACR